ncbi:DUF1217 domain-containing protein [Peteryoungia desertarenae]|nr:DUF1217 domain-containing protein [Peteryoungia desertarenae]
MVSTFLSYNLVTRDIKATLNRAAQDQIVARDAAYYRENIGNVKTVDEFLDDFRLYSYAMKAHGLEDMTYARAFMKKVLESDLNDENSYANKLTDKRYREFAAAFQFGPGGGGTLTPITSDQTDAMIGLYNQNIANLDERITEETRYYNAMNTIVTNVDQFLANDRLREYFFQTFGIDEATYDRNLIRGLLTSDANDPNSYFNTQILPNVINAQSSIEANLETIARIDARAALASQNTTLQSIVTRVTSFRDDIATLEASKSDPGADIAAIDREIDTKQRDIDSRFISYVSMKVGDMTAEIAALEAGKSEAGADIPALQAQIDAIQIELDAASADLAARNAIATQKADRAALEAQKAEPDADIPALQAQIDALTSQITAAEASLIPTDIPDINATIAEKQAQIDAYTGLPALGEDSTALRAQLVSQNNTSSRFMGAAAGYQNIVDAFQFNADGTVPADGFMSAANLEAINTNYLGSQDRVTRAAALMTDEYVRSVINTFTTVEEMMSDSRVASYIKAAAGLSTSFTIVNATLEQAITGDPDDPNDPFFRQYVGTPAFEGLAFLAGLFNFNSDGTLPAGQTPISASNQERLSNGYFSGYNDVDDAADEREIATLRTTLAAINRDTSTVATVDQLLANSVIYNFAVKAVGLDPAEVSRSTMRRVLTSNLDDPRSFVYTLGDERYVEFAKLFNYDEEGNLTWAKMAQSESTLKDYAKDYTIQKTRFLEGTELEQAREAASDEVEYYQNKIATLTSRDELLADRRIVDFLLIAKGIDPKSVTNDFMRQMFLSDLDDPRSAANTTSDTRFSEIVASFNFNAEGRVIRLAGDSIQEKGDMVETMNLFLRQQIETNEGASNAGVRLALYFERMAGSLTSPYDILGDTALYEFFRTTFGLPAELGSMDVDQQAKVVEQYLDMKDLADPEKVKKLVTRFTAMYDVQNDTSFNGALTLLTGNSGSVGISADLMFAISQLRS